MLVVALVEEGREEGGGVLVGGVGGGEEDDGGVGDEGGEGVEVLFGERVSWGLFEDGVGAGKVEDYSPNGSLCIGYRGSLHGGWCVPKGEAGF